MKFLATPLALLPLSADVRRSSTVLLRKGKGKEEYLYSTILADTPLTKRSDKDHTVLAANYTMSAFLRYVFEM